MATAVTDELKNELMSRGIWADFVRVRADVKERGEAKTSRTQTIAALEQLAPDLVERVLPRGRPPKNAFVKLAPDFPQASQPKSLADVKRERRDARAGGDSVNVPFVSRDMFAKKSCSNMTSLIWAVESLAFVDVRPEDAPSALAWSLYSLMATSPSTKADMAKVVAAKIAQRASAEEENGGQFDGEGEYDMAVAIEREGEG